MRTRVELLEGLLRRALLSDPSMPRTLSDDIRGALCPCCSDPLADSAVDCTCPEWCPEQCEAATQPQHGATVERETQPRDPGCVCHLEVGDSPCPVHGDESGAEFAGAAPVDARRPQVGDVVEVLHDVDAWELAVVTGYYADGLCRYLRDGKWIGSFWVGAEGKTWRWPAPQKEPTP